MSTQKQSLRRRILRRLRCQSERSRLLKSRRIQRRLCRLPIYRRARRVLCYVSFDGEVETGPLLKRMLAEGRRVAVPAALSGGRMAVVEISDLKRDLRHTGLFGIPHPEPPWKRVPPAELDLVILPGIAFAPDGHRLGRGKGYFDRFLERVPKRVRRVGLGFDFQVTEKLPRLSHDQPVDRVITESAVYANPARR